MIQLIHKLFDALIIIIGFVFGKKQSDLEHELASEKSIRKSIEQIKTKQKTINDEYDQMLADYNQYINNGLSKSNSIQPKK